VKTLIYQVWGGERPDWIAQCMATVRAWAARAGYHYEEPPFEEFMADVPDWLVARCGGRLIHPLLDYARVMRAEEYLRAGWDRVAWFDADVLVTRPEGLALPEMRAGFMSETWTLWIDGEEIIKRRLTNCICSFVAGDPFTGAYLERMRSVGMGAPQMTKALLGTDLLTQLSDSERPEVIRHVGSLSPHALSAIVEGRRDRIQRFLQETGEALYAANICASHEGAEYSGVTNDAQSYGAAVALLLRDPRVLDLAASC
jgi:hypothetical protein